MRFINPSRFGCFAREPDPHLFNSTAASQIAEKKNEASLRLLLRGRRRFLYRRCGSLPRFHSRDIYPTFFASHPAPEEVRLAAEILISSPTNLIIPDPLAESSFRKIL